MQVKLASHEKTNTVGQHLHEVFRVIKIIKTETVIVVARDYGREDRDQGLIGPAVFKNNFFPVPALTHSLALPQAFIFFELCRSLSFPRYQGAMNTWALQKDRAEFEFSTCQLSDLRRVT